MNATRFVAIPKSPRSKWYGKRLPIIEQSAATVLVVAPNALGGIEMTLPVASVNIVSDNPPDPTDGLF